ncbi:MAG: ribosome biosynthesis protein rrb1 [Caeruleum heppii]|nr:MAG: ribosome biosynthesis protein rrb1 [Caeruleum heppii]
MGKRSADVPVSELDKTTLNGNPSDYVGEEGEFEDEYEDEFESEDEIIEAGVDGRPDEEREAEEKTYAMDVDKQTFMPGRTKLAPGESLAPDPSTYDMLHTLTTTWPCLSFDIVPDGLGDNRKTYPATLYAAAGTQAEAGREKENELLVMKFSGLSRMERDREEEESEDEDDEDADPILESKSIPLSSTTNRIRVHQMPPSNSSVPATTLTATMTESGKILIHDITPHLTSFDTPGTVISPTQNQPLSTIRSHTTTEGYALDWSPLIPQGKLLTGDNDGRIFVSTGLGSGGFTTDARPFTGHTSSVEELQWSPNERNVFASGSADGTVKIWDLRSKSHTPALSVQVSDTDINVMSWSPQTAHLLATGDDDGAWAVWDLRQWKSSSSSHSSNTAADAKTPVASFSFHHDPITSIEWHPTDDSIVAVAAADNTITLWDLAVELDDEESRETAGVADVPPQLLFVHYMEMVKELHWQRQAPGVVVGTGSGGFGIFKTISV